MSSAIISVENLGKKYLLRHQAAGRRYVALRDVIADKAKSFFKKLKPENLKFQKNSGISESQPVSVSTKEEFWALKDVSFEVKQGEAVGIIGRNGAGKSTLLKLLSRITEPTTGRICLRGRVASLLEVGTGFHPELTGRENIFLNGAILGMHRTEIKKKFDEIVAFAEVEKFLDTPVKHYSSGMYMRLAFAVAAHLEPEILIVDEVLAVGDAQFQKKCLGKMQDVSQREGRTVLFVSHNMSAISELTQRCVYMEAGEIKANGATPAMVQKYLSFAAETGGVFQSCSTQSPRVDRIEIKTSRPNQVQISGEPLEIDFTIEHGGPRKAMCFSFQLINQFGTSAGHCWIYDQDQPICREGSRTVLKCHIPKLHLNVGTFYLRTHLSEPPGGQFFETLEVPLSLEVSIVDKHTLWGWRPDACAYLEEYNWAVA
jgi:ABC-type polysaccharide/polyol phosphate transport system ATPase subunit